MVGSPTPRIICPTTNPVKRKNEQNYIADHTSHRSSRGNEDVLANRTVLLPYPNALSQTRHLENFLSFVTSAAAMLRAFELQPHLAGGWHKITHPHAEQT